MSQKPQLVQSAAARLLQDPFGDTASIFQELHWLLKVFHVQLKALMRLYSYRLGLGYMKAHLHHELVLASKGIWKGSSLRCAWWAEERASFTASPQLWTSLLREAAYLSLCFAA